MSLFRKSLLLVVLCIIGGSLHAQKKEADEFFEKGKYFKALKLYNLYDKIDKRPNALVRRGICNYESNRLDNCILDMKKAFSQGKRSEEIFYYLAKSYHDKQQFENAGNFYKLYLDKVKNDPDKRIKATLAIKQCGYAFNAQYKDENGLVENLGDIINTKSDELLAIYSPNVNGKFYFSSNREGSVGGLRSWNGEEDAAFGDFKMDLYYTFRENGSWVEPEELNALINSSKNEILQDINEDGSILFYSHGINSDHMRFMVDTFASEELKVELDALVGPFVAELGDKDIVSLNDSTFIFSSRRVGGYGGYDLYVAAYREEAWQTPYNLGPEINSSYDEVSPWMTNDGARIYFSSNRRESFGGFDIFTAVYDVKSLMWSDAENMALPINSTNDDLYYRVSNDGKTGLLSSDRKSGEGGFDLYQVFLKVIDNSQRKVRDVVQLYESYYQAEQEILAKKARIDSLMRAENIVSVDTTIIEIGDSTAMIIDEVKKQLEVIVEPFLYGEDDNMLTSSNIRKLNFLADALKLAPEVRLLLISNSVSEDLIGFDLYFSYKRGEKLIKYLKGKGVKDSQIDLIGVGSQYPLVKERVNGKKVPEAEIYNRRIDALLFNHDNSVISVVEKMPMIAYSLKEKTNDRFLEDFLGFRYRVMVGLDKNMIKSDIVYDNKDVIIQRHDGKNLYTAGIFKKFDGARNHMEQLRLRGIKNPEVIPFIDGKMIKPEDVIRYSKEYKDLEEFLIDNND